MKSILPLLLFASVPGLFLTIGGILLLVKSWRFAAAAARTKGAVVAIESELHETTDGDGGSAQALYYHPVVEFIDARGAGHRARTKTGSNPATAAVGEKVTVLYDRNDPLLVDIESVVQLWVIPGTLIALGILVLGFVAAGAAYAAPLKG